MKFELTSPRSKRKQRSAFLAKVVGHLVALEINSRNLPLHPAVQLFTGELGSQKFLNFLRLLNLPSRVVQVLLGDRDANVCRRDLLVDLGQLFERQVFLQLPVVGPPLPAAEDG